LSLTHLPTLAASRLFFNQIKTVASFDYYNECNYSVPLFEKEGLGKILLDKSPFFKGEGE